MWASRNRPQKRNRTDARSNLRANHMSDRANQVTPWTIKGMPVAVRKRATECAQRLDETVAEWMTRAVNRQADMEARNVVIPPGKPEANRVAQEPVSMPQLDLAGLGAAVQAVTAAYQAAGAKVPRAIGREAKATIEHYLRGMRGLPPRQTGRRNGQTAPLIEGEGLGKPEAR